MVAVASKASLSPQRKRLVELMQGLNFGSVEGLHVRAGEPTFNPPLRVIREVKFGGDNGPRLEMARRDFALKAEVLDLFAQMDAMGDGIIRSLEVKHGLPFKMAVEEDAA